MATVTEKGVLDAALGRLDALEYASLVWGFVDGGLSEEQLRRELASAVQACQPPGDDDAVERVMVELLESRLLFEFKTPQGELLYRTRFAEGVRLAARLRQLFRRYCPPGGSWISATTLVADFRVDVRPRRYPARNLDPQAVFADIEAKEPQQDVARAVWQGLTTRPNGTSVELSGFQARAASHLLADPKTRGIIVTAGTGSGKTWAFYLPTLAGMAGLVQASEAWTKCLAIYPRVELLKDQFAEALHMCSRIAPVLVRHGRRPLTVGTLFGDTPRKADLCKWQKGRHTGDLVCPYGRCPAEDCGSDLVWSARDRNAGRERLECAKCGFAVDEESIVLTRARAMRSPPDILFTTTEMLNKRIADTGSSRLLGVGVGPERRPRFVLLDEVHTYTGTTGAQSALVLRRWRHASQAKASFIGLSATLLGARGFFQQLTGLPEYQIQEVGTPSHEMVEEGMEYQLVLQGDPVSQSSLLSTSIQTAMLLGRLQDPLGSRVSGGRYGERVFVFTDNLDVTNRLYDDLRDAERQHLAQLRTGRHPGESEIDAALRNHGGQSWRALESIGHDLGNRLRVGRTSSRDPGVASEQNVVVATASLEVGFNDPGVGAVIQHKAPQSMATFLQRKGRAGRPRGMRPWIVTVLSDYGRDRLAYQNYDQLFDPTLQGQNLPVKNLYILRMQALAACLDWLALRAPGAKAGWYWWALSCPEGASKNQDLCNAVRRTVKELLNLKQDMLESLSLYIAQALDLSQTEVEAILWSPPRSLLLEALPMLQRRLATYWRLVHGKQGETDFFVPYLPLPEFLPPNLFTELSLPEVLVRLDDTGRIEPLPILRALKEILPGRVTRRFAEYSDNVSHWVPLDLERIFDLQRETGCYLVECEFSLDRYVDLSCESLGEFELPGPDGPCPYPVYRPWRLLLSEKRDDTISDSCNAVLEWHTDIQPVAEPLEFGPSRRSRWRGLVDSVALYVHAQAGAVTIRRFGVSALASVRRRDDEAMARLRFLDADDRPVGLGFEFETDGLAFTYRLPLAEELARRPLSEETRWSTARAFFKDSVLEDTLLVRQANHFQLDWLQQVYLTTLVTWAATKGLNLSDALEELRAFKGVKPYLRAMKVILGLMDTQPDFEADGNPGPDHQPCSEDRLVTALRAILEQFGVLERLHELATRIFKPDPRTYGAWLRSKVHESMAQALHYACIQNVPRHTAMQNILVDPEGLDPVSETARIWVTEDALGGAGTMEALAAVFLEDPGRLFSGIEAAVAPSDRELVAIALERILSTVVADPAVAEAMAEMRQAYLHESRAKARDRLHALLGARGIHLGKAACVALDARLLRPGTDTSTNALLWELIDRWNGLQARLGVAVGLREFCAITALDANARARILAIAPTGEPGRIFPAQLLMGILWPRGNEVRQSMLASYNPYRNERGFTDPHLVTELLLQGVSGEVRLEEPDWLHHVHQELAAHGCCRLSAVSNASRNLAVAVARILAIPVDVGHLQFYPLVERYEEDAMSMSAVLALWEDATSMVSVLAEGGESG